MIETTDWRATLAKHPTEWKEDEAMEILVLMFLVPLRTSEHQPLSSAAVAGFVSAYTSLCRFAVPRLDSEALYEWDELKIKLTKVLEAATVG